MSVVRHAAKQRRTTVFLRCWARLGGNRLSELFSVDVGFTNIDKIELYTLLG